MQAGLRVALLEARDRIGGRAWTLEQPESPIPIELGAEFVHGDATATFDALAATGLAAVELGERHWVLRCGRFAAVKNLYERVEVLRTLFPRRARRDRSLAEVL